MNPVLLSLGPVTILTQGIILFIAFFLSFFIVWRLFKNNLLFIRYKVTIDQFFDSVFVFFISFGIGARLLYIIEHFKNFQMHPFYTVLFLHFPGFSFLGGVIGGGIGLYIWSKKIKVPFFLLSDTFVIGTSLALAITRIGNFFQAEAYGRVTTVLGVHMANMPGLRHPVQIYESLILFIIFFFLYRMYSRGAKTLGRITFFFLLLLGFERFFIEFLRGDGVYLLGISSAQIISLLFVVVALVGIFKNNRWKKVMQDTMDWLYVDELLADTKRFLRIKK